MANDLLKKKLFATTLLAGVAGGLWAGAAIAQEVDEEEVTVIEEVSDEDEARQEKIVITGSRIARDSFSSTAPLQVITADTIREAGLVDLGDILKTTSVVNGSQLDQTVTTSGFLGEGGPGGASVGLRGLDPERTLVLVNGRRYAPAGVEGAPSFPDISLIPSSVVSRIDVLLDGASSVYGSDAVAGVVNVILRDEYDGFNVEAFRTFPQGGSGGEQTSMNFIMGSTGDRGSYMFAGEYVYNEPLKANSRDWMASTGDGVYCDRAIGYDYTTESEVQQCNPAQSGIGALQNDAGVFVLTYGLPGTTAAQSDAGFGVPGIGGIPDFVNGRGDLAVSPNGYGRWRDYTVAGQEVFDVQPEFQRTSLFFSGKRDIDLLGGMELFTEFSFTNRQTSADTGRGQFTVPVPAENPYNPFGVNAAPGTLGTSAATGPLDASMLLLRPWNDQIYVELDQYRLVGGARGDYELMGDTWDYEVFGGYTRSQGFSERTGVNEINLALSAYSTTIGTDGVASCGLASLTEDPAIFGGFFGLDLEECVPINFFAPSLYSGNPEFAEGQAAVDYLREVRSVTTFVDQTMIGGYTTGSLMELPAGDLQAVVGFEWREDAIDTRSDAVSQRAILDGFFFDRPTRGSVNLGEVYGELFIPIAKDMVGIDNLEMELAGRLVDHEFYGQNSTYSVKGAYSPTDWITVRGTYGTSFRAPNLRELFLEGQSSFETAIDPCEVPATAIAFDPITGDPFYDAAEDNRQPQILTNCALEGLDPTSLGLGGGSSSFQAVNGGNTGLDPETSTAWSAGFVIEQPFFDSFDLTFGVSIFDLLVEDTVFTPTLNQILGLCYTADNFPDSTFCTRRARDANTGFLTEVDATPFNVSERVSKGVDYNLNFATDFMALGQEMVLNVDLEATYQDELSTLVTVPGEPDDFNEFTGDIGVPEWRASLRGNLDVDNFTFFWQTRYIGQQEDPTPPSATVGDRATYKVGEYLISDISASYSADDWSFRIGMQNVFDEEPPLVDQDATGNVSARNVPLGVGYDQIGRRIFVGVAKSF